jgi:hypothetical protein
MEHKHMTVAFSILALVVVGMFVFAYLKKSEIAEAPAVTPGSQVENDGPYANITRIDAKHFFIPPTHTLAGEILMPTPCDLLDYSDVQIQESSPETVTVNFKVVNHAEMCAEVVTPQRFMVSFDAQKDAVIKATFEGRPVELNLIPAAEGETPADFELFLKG